MVSVAPALAVLHRHDHDPKDNRGPPFRIMTNFWKSYSPARLAPSRAEARQKSRSSGWSSPGSGRSGISPAERGGLSAPVPGTSTRNHCAGHSCRWRLRCSTGARCNRTERSGLASSAQRLGFHSRGGREQRSILGSRSADLLGTTFWDHLFGTARSIRPSRGPSPAGKGSEPPSASCSQCRVRRQDDF